MIRLLAACLGFGFGFIVACSGGGGGTTTPALTTLTTPIPMGTEPFDTYLSEQMTSQSIPAMSVLIFRGDTVLHTAILGSSDSAQLVPLTENDVFLLASISKVVTAASLMRLIEGGTISIDGKINDHLAFAVNIPNQTGDVTFEHLLTHTSSIDDDPALDTQYYDNQDSPITLEDYFSDYFTPGAEYYDASENFINSTPGTQYSYSNAASALIGLLVQRISHMDFKEYTQQNIFNPLGMSRASWTLSGITSTIVTPSNVGDCVPERAALYTFTDYPNGGLRATASDLHKFLTAFVLDGLSNSARLLNADTITKMTTVQNPSLSSEMGLHLFLLDESRGLWGHDGGECGVETLMGFNTSTDVGAIILTNRQDANLDEILTRAYDLGLTL